MVFNPTGREFQVSLLTEGRVAPKSYLKIKTKHKFEELGSSQGKITTQEQQEYYMQYRICCYRRCTAYTGKTGGNLWTENITKKNYDAK